jgi:hypothetical protein
MSIIAGNGGNFSGNAGGPVGIAAGTGGFLGVGGGITLTAGNGGSTSTGNAGGGVVLVAGNGAGSGNNAGGSVTLRAGTPSGSGPAGVISVGQTNAGQVNIGRSGIRVAFPTGTTVEGMARIKNGTAIVATDTADAGERMVFDPTGGTFTLNAPASPSIGDRWGVKNRSANTTAVTIAGNGSNIEDPTSSYAVAASFSLSGDGIAVEWEYDGTQWLVI